VKAYPCRLLGDVCEVLRGTIITKKKATPGNIPVIAGGLQPAYFHSEANRPGNIITVSGSGANAGYVNFYDSPIFASDCSTILPNNPNRLDVRYVYYFMLSVQEYINKELRRGAAQPHVYPKDLSLLEMPIPTIHEQKRIVAALDVAFEKISGSIQNCEQNISNSFELYTSVMEKLFAETVKQCTMIKFGDIIETLTDYHANGSCKVLKKHVKLEDTENYAWMVRSTDFENDFKNGFRYIDESAYNFLKKSRVFGGEIIISKIGNAGKVYIMPNISRPCSLAMNLFLIRLNEEKMLNKFVFRYLRSRSGEAQIRSKLKGVATQTITKASVRSLQIPMLSIEKQKRIISYLDQFEIHTKVLESIYHKKKTDLNELKQSILQKTFAREKTLDSSMRNLEN